MFPKGITVEDAQLYDKITKLQTTIIDRLSDLRKISRSCPCSHFIEMPESCENYLSSQNYYNKFWQLYLKTQLGHHKSLFIAQQVEEMEKGIQDVEDLFQKLEEVRTQNLILKKKTRRKAEDINRVFLCPARACFRSYGSQLALKVHIKQKHPGKDANVNKNTKKQEIY